MKKICFILPEVSSHPVGGYKIVFEYANRLANDNFNVSILFLNDMALKRFKVPKVIKNTFENYRTFVEPKWFKLNSKIKKISSTKKNYENKLYDTDIAIATAVETVDITKKLFKNSKKFYLIQGLENWNVSNKELFKTYRSGFTNIVISKWLKDIVDKHSDKPAVYIQNPIDINEYKIINPIKSRSPFIIGMLNHKSPFKGSNDGIKAIKIVKKKYPQLKVIMFGTVRPSKNLPNWIDYHWNATMKETISIYNTISIFVNPSIKEGFGLTGLESMACGAALVSTDYSGVKEYAINNKNSLLSPVHDPYMLAENIEYLVRNNDLRFQLASTGNKNAQFFSWKIAYKKFKDTILN